MSCSTRWAPRAAGYSPEGEVEIPAIRPAKVVDTTGAGDAFRAGYFAGIYRNYSIKDSARLGASAASFVIEARGSLTNVPDWAAGAGKGEVIAMNRISSEPVWL